MTVRPGARAAAERLPRAPGVYRFRDGADRVLYVGRATDLRRRACSYWGDLGDRGHLTAMVAQVRHVEAVVCDSAHEAAWLERNLHERELPPWNRSWGGQEVPMYVRVEVTRNTWQLTTTHTPTGPTDASCYGPYLGGAKVRTAVRALRRAFPGPELARVRGVEAADPAAARAVLERDPPAVTALRDAFRQRRDDAAGRLAFEVAGRVQQEWEAVDWLVAEQRVTTREPVDLDTYGWCAGVLVRFGVRRGKTCEWEQTRCPRSAAAARLRSGPADWHPFADRTARLAALLR